MKRTNWKRHRDGKHSQTDPYPSLLPLLLVEPNIDRFRLGLDFDRAENDEAQLEADLFPV